MSDLMKFFQARKTAYQTHPRLIEEVLYTTYSYSLAPVDAPSKLKSPVKNTSDTVPSQPKVGDLLGMSEGTEGEVLRAGTEQSLDIDAKVKMDKRRRKFDAGGGTNAEIFMFEYGTVVIWGMTESEEKRFLSSMYAHLSLPLGTLDDLNPPIRKRFEVERLGTVHVKGLAAHY